MVSNEKKDVPKGRIIPVYLTDEGDVHPIFFHNMEELELIQQIIAGLLDYKVVVDPKTFINNPEEKISIIDLTKKKN